MANSEKTSDPIGQLRRFQTAKGSRWAFDERFLAPQFSLRTLLGTPRERSIELIHSLLTDERPIGKLLAPIDPSQEVWACGVTFMQSRVAREIESTMGDIYLQVYGAERPEIFFKSLGWRVIGDGGTIRVRNDSAWSAPEPEVTLVVNRYGETIGYCAGNDVSSRDIEGENPLYLPQAKIYDGSCALGPAIELIREDDQLRDLRIELMITRQEKEVYRGETRTTEMKRQFNELVEYLFREMAFPEGVFLMTGTGIVPDETFNLQPGDSVQILVNQLAINNKVK